jgi:hypothetical protein
VTQLDEEGHVRKYAQFLLPSAGMNFVWLKTSVLFATLPREMLLHATECEFVIPLNYLKPEVTEIILKNSVSTLQKTPLLHSESSSK